METGRRFILDLAHYDENTKLKDVMIEVDPETVCQYTGLTDKNGRKIFEGDILKIPYEHLEDRTTRSGGDMTADERRSKAIKAYCKAYREYQQLDNVREHICVEMSGDTLIEIHRYYGEREGERVLRVMQEEEKGAETSAEVIAYERAVDQLLSMIKRARKRLEENKQCREARRWA